MSARMSGGYNSIKLRLSLLIAATIIGIGALLCTVYLSWEWAERKSDIDTHVSWMANNISLLAADALAQGDTATVRNIIRSAVETEKGMYGGEDICSMEYVEVIGPGGNLVAVAEDGMAGTDTAVMESKRKAAALSGSPSMWLEYLDDGCALHGAIHPAYNGSARVGTVSVGVCDTPARKEMARYAWQSAGLVALAGLCGAVVAARISGRFTRPVMELVDGAGEVSSGNLDHRVAVSGPREMKLLADGFNDMAASLKEKIEGMESARLESESLNARLAQSFGEATRTAEKLREANDWMTEMALRMDNANTQLKAEMNQTETIVHSIKDGLVALDKDETILLMNPVAEEIFDVRGEEVKGRNVQVLVDRLVEKVDEPEVFLRKFMAASSSPESESMFNITLARPFRKVLRRMSSAIRDESGAVTGRVVVLSDITREKEVDNMKSNFVSIVSHELRTPLTSIKGALALLLDGQMDDPDTRREFLSIADQNTDRLMSLISGLLDLSRMESGMVRLNVARLDMAGLITSLVRSAELFAGRRGITIETRFSGGKQEVFGDRGQLGQVITNLLDNAVKFSPDGGRVVVRTDAAEDEFTITVEDEGPGIPADKLEKVFERFYQVDMSATRVMGGTGLGLAICRAIISEHAGKIRAESPARPGVGGARIVVKLPKAGIVSRNANPPSVHPVNPASYADSGDDARDTVLLVDKDQEALRVQSMQFGREGYRVITATAGSDALRLARDCRPGFIFMDTDLPDIGGLDVAVMLGKDPDTKDIPIVFTTSAGETGTGQTDGHASGFIVKPYKVNELVATVRQYYM